MLAGLLAALCAIAFAKVLAEPQIAKAERFETTLDAQEGKAAEKPLVSRGVQDTAGLGVGLAAAGVALGGLFGLSFAGVYRRVGQAGPRTTAVLLALAGFVAIFLVPFLKYPANPPSVGNPDTIGRRTGLYFLAIVVGLVAVTVAAIVHRQLSARHGPWNAALAAAVPFLALVVFAYLVMPGIDEVPAGFPASVLWNFRLASAGTQAVLWGAIGFCFGGLTERAERAGRPATFAGADRQRAAIAD